MAIDALEPDPLVRLLGPSTGWDAADLVRAVEQLQLRQVNLRYVGGDGRLKTLAFPVGSREHVTEVLVRGERVDGSSIFTGTDAGASDVYLVPRHRTAFVNPFGERPSLDVLCSFYDPSGAPLPYAREQVVRRAAEVLEEETGMTLEAFGELEYYLVDEPDPLYPVEAERGYQESGPFAKGERVREQVLGHLTAMGVQVKYVHGEVGSILEDDRQLVQHEIELRPVLLEQAADALVLTRWVVREVAASHGLEATFAPLVSDQGAGNGLHVHSRLVRDGVNETVDDDGLSVTGRRLVAGYLSAARALTAFACTVPTSYLRLELGEESPEEVCWGEQDRTGLVRVPLAWGGDVLPGMVAHANPGMPVPVLPPTTHPQTVELRLGDGSADVHLLLAGMAVAARQGLADPGSLELARRLSTAGRGDSDDGPAGDSDEGSAADRLPASCGESADALEAARGLFEAHGVFPPALVDQVLGQLREADEATAGEDGPDGGGPEELVRRYWHVA
ncbi:glutamine synthetase beta-grasp domain-containing protein [Aquipuribacter hungaricus]|uniref:glutamine synthetase n=1 Tax=Aquipuribacter hungaricus TaxID=545624 RepID=A0ABV7WEE7_9MICO